MPNPQYIPGHKHVDHGVPIDAVPTNAKCDRETHNGLKSCGTPCPRHHPTAYAANFARHADERFGLIR